MGTRVVSHRDVMVELARRHGWRRGVELGIGSGHLFERFLALGIDMIGVDLGIRADRRARANAAMWAAKSKAARTIYWESTLEAAARVPDGWADFVFIDAGHSYDAVKEDIRLWAPKVRAGGWLGGHDYSQAYCGVIVAVQEAFGDRGVRLHPFHVWERAP